MENKWLPENYDKFDTCFHNNELIFFNIPKNASTSIRNTLSLNKRESFFKTPNRSNCKKIMVIRNPYERIISSFNEVKKLRTDGPREETLKSDWFKIQKNDLEKGFKMFLDYIDGRIYDSHVHTQSDWFNAKKIDLEDIDFLILFEDLNKEFDDMCKQLKLKNRLQKSNFSKNKENEDRLKNLINSNEEVKKKIEKIYREDIELYNKVLKIKNK